MILTQAISRWVGRTDSGRPAPQIVESGRPKMENGGAATSNQVVGQINK